MLIVGCQGVLSVECLLSLRGTKMYKLLYLNYTHTYTYIYIYIYIYQYICMVTECTIYVMHRGVLAHSVERRPNNFMLVGCPGLAAVKQQWAGRNVYWPKLSTGKAQFSSGPNKLKNFIYMADNRRTKLTSDRLSLSTFSSYAFWILIWNLGGKFDVCNVSCTKRSIKHLTVYVLAFAAARFSDFLSNAIFL